MAARSPYALVLIGSGPGIGQSVATLFAAKRYNHVALIARRQQQLDIDRKAVEAAAPGVNVSTFVTDVADGEQFKKVLRTVSAEGVKIETVYFNPAVIRPTSIEEETEDQMIYDFKITNIALLHTAQWAMPKLVDLAESDASAKPSFLVTGTWLSRDPYTPLFTLSLVKAAQRNMCQTLAEVFTPKGVHVGMVRVMGVVDSAAKETSPQNIASCAWNLYESKEFEIEV